MLMLLNSQHVLHETQEACKCSADFSQSDVNVSFANVRLLWPMCKGEEHRFIRDPSEPCSSP